MLKYTTFILKNVECSAIVPYLFLGEAKFLLSEI